MAKNYSVKVNDFQKITKNKNLLTSEQKIALEKYESILNVKSDKFLPRGKDIILIISENEYYITAKPVYVDSIAKILSSVGIQDENIHTITRTSGSQVNITVEQLKNLLCE